MEDPGALMVREVLDRVVRGREVTAAGRELLETHRLWKTGHSHKCFKGLAVNSHIIICLHL